MSEKQNNTVNSLAQGKYPWGLNSINKISKTASSWYRAERDISALLI